jgi:alpha-tubulin suppressor-like RCC1 family protein
MLTAPRRWLVRCGLPVVCAVLACGCGGAPGHRGGARAAASGAHGRRATRRPPVLKIAAGGFAGYAVLADGRVWAWGDDLEGQIGRAGAWQSRSTPVEVPGIANVVAVAGGGNTGYALQRGGAVWAWGDDSVRELGDSSESPRHTPTRVHTPGGIAAIAAGMFSAYALRQDGTVWAWGDNAVGQLGISEIIAARGRPRPVQRLTGMVAIAAGASDGYALTRNGTVWAWGDGSLGQLGAAGCAAGGPAADRSRCPAPGVPVRIRGLTGVTAIAAGANTGYALRRDGTVWAWGDSSFGALGAATKRAFLERPERVVGLQDVDSIGAGSSTGYAVLRDGSVWAWGRGVDGELGDRVFADSAVPRPVLGLTGARRVVGGGAMAYALDRQRRIWAWGGGLYGQLGNGYRLSLAQPTQVLRLSPLAATL